MSLDHGVFDPDIRPQLCNLHLRLQQLLSHRPLPLKQMLFCLKQIFSHRPFPLQQLLCHRPLPLHPLQRKRLRLRIRPQQLHLQLRPRPLLAHIAPTTPPLPLPRTTTTTTTTSSSSSSLRRRQQLLRAVSARLLLHDGPHALVGHGGGEVSTASARSCGFVLANR